jgi:hypothetical protein
MKRFSKLFGKQDASQSILRAKTSATRLFDSVRSGDQSEFEALLDQSGPFDATDGKLKKTGPRGQLPANRDAIRQTCAQRTKP